MKSKIIVLLLTLLGFGSCCNKPHKRARKQDAEEPAVVRDSVIPAIRLMYGVPYRTYQIPGPLPPDTTGR